MTAVAVPNPDIAAPIPVAGPTQIVAAAQAVPPAAQPAPQTQPVVSAPAASAAPAIQQITYGQGEGRQPAPEYPREAQLAHQQGVVVIRFTVDEEGSVVEADATTPCPFPLLNQAALRAVRETWRFPPGAPRAYEVAIRFQLRKS
jgi:protein TonB